MSTLGENGSEDQAGENQQLDELGVLKSRAKMMGVVFSNNIGLEALRAKVEAKMNGEADEPREADVAKLNPLAGDRLGEKPSAQKSIRQQLLDSEMRLVRLRITNLDPKKKDLPGEILCIANEYLGTVRKFVPFGEVTDDGFHVPYCLYTMMKGRKFLNIRTVKDRRTGTVRVEQGWANEFALEVLDPLTPSEIAQLATAQKAAGSVD